MRPKCTSGQGRCPSPRIPPQTSAFNHEFWPSGLRSTPPRQIPGYAAATRGYKVQPMDIGQCLVSALAAMTYVFSPPLRRWRYCAAWHHAVSVCVCVSVHQAAYIMYRLHAALVSAAKVMCCIQCSLVRPPGTLVPGGLMFYPWCFFSFFLFLSPRYLRAPSTNRRETLPHDHSMGALYNASLKIRRALPPKKLGPKTCKIWRDFRQLQTSITNISGKGQDIQNRKEKCSPAIPSAFPDKSPVNFGPLTTEN